MMAMQSLRRADVTASARLQGPHGRAARVMFHASAALSLLPDTDHYSTKNFWRGRFLD
jgi:hypothetical protein